MQESHNEDRGVRRMADRSIITTDIPIERKSSAPRVYATFRLLGKRLQPDYVTGQLRIAPWKAFRAGDKHGRTGIWKHGYWGLTSQGHVSSSDLSVHVKWLLDRLEPVMPQVAAILSEPDVGADIVCFWDSSTSNVEPCFSSDLIRRLSALNLGLVLDIYLEGHHEPDGTEGN